MVLRVEIKDVQNIADSLGLLPKEIQRAFTAATTAARAAGYNAARKEYSRHTGIPVDRLKFSMRVIGGTRFRNGNDVAAIWIGLNDYPASYSRFRTTRQEIEEYSATNPEGRISRNRIMRTIPERHQRAITEVGHTAAEKAFYGRFRQRAEQLVRRAPRR